MGKHGRSGHYISTHQVLPVFKVISALEDPECTSLTITHCEHRREPDREYAEEEGSSKRKLRKMENFENSRTETGNKLRCPKAIRCKKDTKKYAKYSPEKLNFAANFTTTEKVFHVNMPTKRRGIFASNDVAIIDNDAEQLDKSVDNFENLNVNPSDNPVYEDPRDVVQSTRQISKRCSDLSMVSKEGRAMLRQQKKKLVKKYGCLIASLVDRCEDNMALLTEKHSQLAKMKEKLKLALTYNDQFAEENERLRTAQGEADARLSRCRDVARQLEERCRELEEKVGELERAGRDEPVLQTRLVEVCMSCNTREIVVRQARQHSAALLRDMDAMKDVIYRLNIQLSRYQEKLRTMQNTCEQYNEDTTNKDRELLKVSPASTGSPADRVVYSNIFESLNEANSVGISATQGDVTTGDSINVHFRSSADKRSETPTDLNVQALAPLLEAYQESIREKDTLILDYERQFCNFNQRLKHVLQENRMLTEDLTAKSEEQSALKDSLKRLAAEKESIEIDKATLAERTEKAEKKLKEVYELYEDKMAAMSRDYQTVFGEYFSCRQALARAESRVLRLEGGERTRTVPADLHERALHDCKRLFEELKYQYGVEKEKREQELARLREQHAACERRLQELSGERDKLNEELKAAQKNVRLYRRAAVVFRSRLRASVAVAASARRRRRRAAAGGGGGVSPQVRAALDKMARIKAEIQSVKSTAYRELAEVERRMASAAEEREREARRVRALLRHRGAAGGGEGPRLKTSSHHVRDRPDTPQQSAARGEELRRPTSAASVRQGSVRLVPAPGGFFQARVDRRVAGSGQGGSAH